jgi:hypothetical protein
LSIFVLIGTGPIVLSIIWSSKEVLDYFKRTPYCAAISNPAS